MTLPTRVTAARPAFIPFDERCATRIYKRNLPHWRQSGTTYFVTFRLGDSIPTAIQQGWLDERKTWLKAHGIAYDGENGQWHQALATLSSNEQFRFHQKFNRAVQTCLDRGLGCCALMDIRCLKAFRSILLAGDAVSYHLGDFIVMPNHVHLLIIPMPGQELEFNLKSIKGSSAVACNKLLGKSGTFWQADSYDHIVRSLEQLVQLRQYIAENPVKSGITVPADACYVAEWMDEWLDL
jgi:putative transposase